MHIAILARVRGLLAQFTEVHGDSVWLPRRALSLTAVYDTGFDAVDLVSTHPRASAACCGGGSTLPTLTR